MNRNSRYIIVLVGIVFLCFSGIAAAGKKQTNTKGLFVRVKKFSRPVFFLNYNSNLLYVKTHRGNDFYWGPEIFNKTIPASGYDFAVRPDETRIYACSYDKIYEFDKALNLIRTVSISDFGLGSAEAIFTGNIYASDNNIWFSVLVRIKNISSPMLRFCILRWNPSLGFSTRTIVLKRDISTTVNYTLSNVITPYWVKLPNSRKLVVAGSNPYVYDCNNGHSLKLSCKNKDYVAIIDEHRFVLSNSQKRGVIEIASTTNDISNTGIYGIMANWGYDKHIYYYDNARLWRCRQDGTQPEIVYCVKYKSRQLGSKDISCVSLKINRDHSLMSLFYMPTKESRDNLPRIVLFDLKKREFMEISNANVFSSGSGWLVKSNHQKLNLMTNDTRYLNALILALEDKNINEVRKILKKGVNVNARDSIGHTPLHIAVETGNPELVKLILDAGAYVDIRDNGGGTALMDALDNLFLYAGKLTTAQEKKIRVAIASLLIKDGANVNLKVYKGYGGYIIHYAVLDGDKDIVALILARHPDINVRNTPEGLTSLHIAAQNASKSAERFEILKLLLKDRDINVNAQDSDGLTPLNYATQDRVRALLKKYGAKPGEFKLSEKLKKFMNTKP